MYGRKWEPQARYHEQLTKGTGTFIPSHSETVQEPRAQLEEAGLWYIWAVRV